MVLTLSVSGETFVFWYNLFISLLKTLDLDKIENGVGRCIIVGSTNE